MIPTNSMWRSWLLLSGLVLIAATVAWRTGGPHRVGQALVSGAQLFLSVLPNLILGFALAGFLYVMLPSELISRWMGSGSGVKGLFIGTAAGMLTPGGPFTHFPILASFLAKGAGVGPICAYITAWGLLGLNRLLVWELPILGPRIAIARFLASLAVPPVVGWLGGSLYRLFRFSALIMLLAVAQADAGAAGRAPSAPAAHTSPSARERRLSRGDGSARLTYNFARSVASDGADGLHVVWSARNTAGYSVAYMRSLDDGETWQAEVPLTDGAIATSQDPLLPTVAAEGRHVYVAWHEVVDGKPVVMCRRSTDRGATWLAAEHVSLSPQAAAHASLAASGESVHLVWGDHRDGGAHAEIYYRRSTDRAATWLPAVRISELLSDSWVPAIAASGDSVYVGWVDTKDGNEEEYLRASHDGGATWQPQLRLTDNRANSWAPSIAIAGRTVHMVWFDQRDAPMHPLEAERMLDEALELVGVAVEPAPSGVMVPHPEGAVKRRAERKLQLIHASAPQWVQQGGDGAELQAILSEFDRMGRPALAEAAQQLDGIIAMMGLPAEAPLPSPLPQDEMDLLRGYLQRRMARIQEAAPAWAQQGGAMPLLEDMMRQAERMARGAPYAEKERKLDEAMRLLGLTLDESQPLGAIQSVHYIDALGMRVQQKKEQLRQAAPAWVQNGGDQSRLQALLQRFDQAMPAALSEWDIYYRRSEDGGATWQPEVRLTRAPGASQRPSIVALSDRLYVAWFDGRDGNMEIYGRFSSDGGRSWSGDMRLTESPGDSLYASVAASTKAVHVVWCDARQGPAAIYYLRQSW